MLQMWPCTLHDSIAVRGYIKLIAKSRRQPTGDLMVLSTALEM